MLFCLKRIQVAAAILTYSLIVLRLEAHYCLYSCGAAKSMRGDHLLLLSGSLRFIFPLLMYRLNVHLYRLNMNSW